MLRYLNKQNKIGYPHTQLCATHVIFSTSQINHYHFHPIRLYLISIQSFSLSTIQIPFITTQLACAPYSSPFSYLPQKSTFTSFPLNPLKQRFVKKFGWRFYKNSLGMIKTHKSCDKR
eukprot:15070_5